MINVVSVDNMRKSDDWTIKNLTSSKELMKRAGESVFDSVNWKAPVAIVCGTGNNAGDGFVLATNLADNGIDCTIFLVKEKFSVDGKFYFDKCIEQNIKVQVIDKNTNFDKFKTIVDCIFGTGFKGKIEGVERSVIEKINNSKAFIVSVDINSGLNGDTGLCDICVKSDLTVSIGAFKTGHFLNIAKDVMKNKINADIGIKLISEPYFLIEKQDLKTIFHERKNFSNKSTYGYIALIGGSIKYSGAIKLANLANSAMRAGAGVVKLAVPKCISQAVMPYLLESTLFPLSDNGDMIVFDENEFKELTRNVKTIAIGMGIGLSDEVEKILKFLLTEFGGTLIIDADALTVLSKMYRRFLKNASCKVVLTPHIKEFSRLTGKSVGEIYENQIETTKQYAKENNCILLLKGTTTIVTDGEKIYLVDRGSPGMATAGSGDVLSGIISAVCAYNQDNLLLAVAGSAYVNGLAGELAENENGAISMVASDTANMIKNAINEIIKDN